MARRPRASAAPGEDTPAERGGRRPRGGGRGFRHGAAIRWATGGCRAFSCPRSVLGRCCRAMPASPSLLKWLRKECAEYRYDVVALFARGDDHAWPLKARDEAELEERLAAGGHFLPLPKEPAALANVLEVSIVDFLVRRLREVPGAGASRGTERGYPDLEMYGRPFGGGYHAVDVKIAMRGKVKRAKPGKPQRVSKNTQSRITLYTGNTYFKYSSVRWPGTFRPFDEYKSHLDVIGIYTLNEESNARVDELELIVQEPWRIASKKRSSTTREYIGAVNEIERIRDGRGDFATESEFYKILAGPRVQDRSSRQQAARKSPRSFAKVASGSAGRVQRLRRELPGGFARRSPYPYQGAPRAGRPASGTCAVPASRFRVPAQANDPEGAA